MSKHFTVIVESEDFSEDDIYVAMEQYIDGMLEGGEIDETLKFEIHSMD